MKINVKGAFFLGFVALFLSVFDVRLGFCYGAGLLTAYAVSQSFRGENKKVTQAESEGDKYATNN